MKKGYVVEIGKMLSKEYFRMYVEDNKKNLKILDDDIIIMGFKEIDEKYIMITSLPKLIECYCELTFDKNTAKLLGFIYIYRKIEEGVGYEC